GTSYVCRAWTIGSGGGCIGGGFFPPVRRPSKGWGRGGGGGGGGGRGFFGWNGGGGGGGGGGGVGETNRVAGGDGAAVAGEGAVGAGLAGGARRANTARLSSDEWARVRERVIRDPRWADGVCRDATLAERGVTCPLNRARTARASSPPVAVIRRPGVAPIG